MEGLMPIIRKSIESDASVQTNSIRNIILTSKFLSIDKQMKYIFQMLGYDSMWVSITREKIPDLIFPTFYIDYAETTGESNNLILVTKKGNDRFILYDLHSKYTGKEVNLTHFMGDGFTFFLFEKKAGFNPGNSEKKRNVFDKAIQYLWLMLPVSILILLLVREDHLGALIVSTSFLGTYIFYLLLKHHFMKDNNFVSAICNTGSGDSCTKVLNYKVLNYKLFDFKLLGLIYFSSLSLIIAASLFQARPLSIGFISSVIILGILGVSYSLYLQIFKIKAFCKICLISSTLILLSTCFFLIATRGTDWAFGDSVQGLFFISIASLISFLFYNTLENRASQRLMEASLTFFKSDRDIFKRVLAMEDKSNVEEHFGIQHFEYGNVEAESTLGLIISLNCPHCYNALGQLLNIIKDSPKNKIKIWVASNDTPTKKEILFLNYLIETNLNSDIGEFYMKLSSWYQAIDKLSIFSQSDEDRFIKGVNMTPVILIDNGVLPHFYSINDLKYLLT